MIPTRKPIPTCTPSILLAYYIPPLDKHVFKGINCATHLLVPGTRGFVFHFASVFHFERSPEIVYCFVFFPPWVILCDVIGWQRGLLGISLAFVHCWLINLTVHCWLINFSLRQKAYCVLFVSEGVVREFGIYVTNFPFP